MIDRIIAHNHINGLAFSVAEFSLFMLAGFPFGIYYLFHQNLALAFIVLGLICNFLMIILFGIRSMLRKEKGGSHKDLFQKTKREALRRKYPHLLRDTLLLVFTLLLPFLLCVMVAFELVMLKKTRVAKEDLQRD
jgi:hypothetical protein